MDKPTKTVSVSAGTRIYYVDARQDKKGRPYVSISEVPLDNNPGKKERQRIFIHHEDLDKVLSALSEVSDHVKQEVISSCNSSSMT